MVGDMLPLLSLKSLSTGRERRTLDVPSAVPLPVTVYAKKKRKRRGEGEYEYDAVDGGDGWGGRRYRARMPRLRCNVRCICIGIAVVTLVLFVVGGVGYAVQQPWLPGAMVCSKNDATTRAMRGAMSTVPATGATSCAVVGSAGHLRLQRLGAEIDSHDFVIRSNLAPVAGYEEIAGSKTSMRVLNSEALATILYEKLCNHSIVNITCPHYPIYMNTDNTDIIDAFKHKCPDVETLGREQIDAWDPMMHALWPGWMSGGNLMSGEWAVGIAARVCPMGFDVYGFTHAGTRDIGNNASYHYYDDRPVNPDTDNLPRSAELLTRLSENQGDCMTLNAPGAHHSSLYHLPNYTLAISDVVSDGIRHRRTSEFYWGLAREFQRLCM